MGNSQTEQATKDRPLNTPTGHNDGSDKELGRSRSLPSKMAPGLASQVILLTPSKQQLLYSELQKLIRQSPSLR